MRHAVWILLLVVSGCTDEHSAKPDAGATPSSVRDAESPHDAQTARGAQDARIAEIARDAQTEHDAEMAHDASRMQDTDEPDAEPTGRESATCQVSTSNPEERSTLGDPPKATTNTWSYDPDTRRLITTVYGYDLDESGRTWRVYANSAGSLTLYWTNHYDEHGKIDRYEHYTAGTSTYTNKYEGDRLVATEVAAHNGQPASRTTYSYADAAAPNLWTKQETDVNIDGSIEYSVERTIVAGRTSKTRETERGMLHHEYTFTYAGDRIDTIERDGGYWPGDGPDGSPNIRFHWARDSSGNVVEFTQDGTDAHDAPFVNGVPDYKEVYSAGCAKLLTQFPWLAHEPAPNSIGPRFRTDAD